MSATTEARDLKNKPLVEAIFEVKWALESPLAHMRTDPHYKLLLGRLYERVHDEYPEHEELPAASVPDEMTGHVVKHRFRAGPNDWPLIQIGPGVLTVNDTRKYRWTDFRTRAIAGLDKLFDAHPKPAELKVHSLLLRYIDAVDFDYHNDDVFGFLKDKMRVSVALPASLYAEAKVKSTPQHLSLQSSFACEKPKGMVHVKFATGSRETSPALLWETMVHSIGEHVPCMPEGFEEWLDAAHEITHDWFFGLIQGELERRFRGD